MARMRSRWYQPFTVDAVQMRGTSVRLSLHIRRWHPAWWWMAVRTVEPRYLWRPDVWFLIVRAIVMAGRDAA